MQVHLFHGPPQDKWFSMDMYAHALTTSLQTLPEKLELKRLNFPRPFPQITGRVGAYLSLLWRLVAYPFLASSHRGPINHILDHSYAHLAYSFPSHNTIITCHDLAPWAMKESFTSLSYLTWRTMINGLKQVTHIIAVSQSTANDLQKFFNSNRHRVHVIPNGVQPHFCPTPSNMRQRLGIPTDKKLILHIGSNLPRKNITILLQSLNYLPPNFILLQVGGNLPRSPQVWPLGYIPATDLPALYSLADVFVFPSKYEGFGLPILEAMACGTPTIAANTSSLPEITGDAGLMVSPHDPQELANAIQRIITEPDLAHNLRQRGLQRVKLFTWEETARQTLTVYQQVWAEVYKI